MIGNLIFVIDNFMKWLLGYVMYDVFMLVSIFVIVMLGGVVIKV